jgi:hypothetical protein
MMFKKKQPASESLESLFEPFRSLKRTQVPALEFLLLGGIAGAVKGIGARSLISELDASNVFSAIPMAATLATGAKTAASVPRWSYPPDQQLEQIRDLVVVEAPNIAARPQQLMEELMPRLQEELSHYAGNRTGQIRSSWGWIMSYLIDMPLYHDDDTAWIGPVLGQTVQRWEAAAAGNR